jgi:hypothetical protein
MRNPRAITEAEVPHAFDATTIHRLAKCVRLPSGCDLEQFGESVRTAVRIFARDAAIPSSNEQHREIAQLYRLANRQHYERLAQAVENISPAVRSSLSERQARIADQVAEQRKWRGTRYYAGDVPNWRIPKPAELRDPATRAQAANGLEALIAWGGHWADGRKRPSGRRSRTWTPELHAPAPSRAEPRREAERTLVMWLQVAVAKIDVQVPETAHYDKPGPFARMAAEVLQLVGATGPANATGLAAELINQLHHERKAQRPREPQPVF